MSALTFPFWALGTALRRRDADVPARTDPPAPRRAPPVFIHDAITPWRGETLLSYQLRKDLEALNADDD